MQTQRGVDATLCVHLNAEKPWIIIEFRRSCGENITPKSPLFRREFDKRDIFAVANDIKPITKASIKIILRQVLYSSGIRTPVPK
jgi:hypothetical protein